MISSVSIVQVSLELWGCFFCVIACFLAFASRNTKGESNHMMFILQLSNAILLFSDAMTWVFRGWPGPVGYYIEWASVFVVFTLSYFILLGFTQYLSFYVSDDTMPFHIWRMSIYFICSVALILLIYSQYADLYYYFDHNNLYYRTDNFWISQVFGLVGMVIDGLVLVVNRRKVSPTRFLAMSSYFIFPFIAVVFQMLMKDLSLLNISITVSAILMFATTQMEQAQKLAEQKEQLMIQERKVNDMQIKIVMSQIQPHFLYNSLNSIYYLCGKNPQLAQRAISDFSDYLRGNLNALKGTNEPVPFTEELKHIEVYLSLEKLRFDDELEIIYDIETKDFFVPPLSIQPLIENAVKHGVGKAINGGTVKFETHEVLGGFLIRVTDDGVGFDQNEERNDDRSHIGIENVKKRLAMLIDATLTIESEPGKGTVATVFIPKTDGNTRGAK
ncbi:MAG: histidine kinase [Lachnospiraceae bacterium]|nr:histidine kinase [Lachnospiraceae bacterium]